MLPALPTGRQCTSGARSERVDDLEGRGLLALDPVGVDRVDQRHRELVGQAAGQPQAVVEVALDLQQPGAVHQRLGQLAGGDLAVRHQHRAGDARP